jgi:DNA end-binding protein Ku
MRGRSPRCRHEGERITGEPGMTARAIWKGELVLGDQRVPVKLYSAVEDQAVHFHLLHATDRVPVEQRIVRKDTGEVVPREAQRKALPVDDERAVILQPEDLETLEPEAGRDIHLLRFVPADLLGDAWFDRPYFLGPDEDDASYASLAQALSQRALLGIARWTMRKKRYLGALGLQDGRLTMTTLRRAEQVLQVPAIEPAKSKAPSEAELKLAEQLLESIAGEFDPTAWENEHRKRLHALIDAKRHGKNVKPFQPKPRAANDDLAESLRLSLAAAKEKKRA